jgi:hypothetical protein
MGAIRKLRRQRSRPKYEVEPLRRGRTYPVKKMSEVLLEFARPMLDFVDDDELYEEVINLAVVCWNLSFLPEHEQLAKWKAITKETGRAHLFSRPEIENWVWILLERKRTFFADDRRIVADFEVIDERDRRRLLVASTLANPAFRE